MSDKRTKAQLNFDYTKHGWAFCNDDMLVGKTIRLQELAKCLASTDKRHEILQQIRAARFKKLQPTTKH